MKRFHFSLRPLAVVRAHHEQRAREAFAAAVHVYVQAEENLARTRVRMADFERALNAGRRACFNAAVEVENLTAYRRECANEGDVERRMLAAREAMERSRAAYIEAHRKLEVVHRLEEKARIAHRLSLAREEQAEFDDFAGRRHFVQRTPLPSP
jgi:flagellar protein FliJ